jgi:hypothetical protein
MSTRIISIHLRVTYAVWQHVRLRTIYAVRLEEHRVTGISGSIPPEHLAALAAPEKLAALPYSTQAYKLGWARRNQAHGQFVPYAR